jgi:hypothetical protein
MRKEQQAMNPPPLYSAMTTRRSSFPTWLLIVGRPSTHMPHLIKRADLGNEVLHILISSNCALQVPPIVNDIAESLEWLIESSTTEFLL